MTTVPRLTEIQFICVYVCVYAHKVCVCVRAVHAHTFSTVCNTLILYVDEVCHYFAAENYQKPLVETTKTLHLISSVLYMRDFDFLITDITHLQFLVCAYAS